MKVWHHFLQSPNLYYQTDHYQHFQTPNNFLHPTYVEKTTYYLRSRPATRINKTTTGGPAVGPDEGEPVEKPTFTDAETVACSLENPESCEAGD